MALHEEHIVTGGSTIPGAFDEDEPVALLPDARVEPITRRTTRPSSRRDGHQLSESSDYYTLESTHSESRVLAVFAITTAPVRPMCVR